ncbi:ferredoxin--NADP(+) reductase [Escherichia coli]
MADWVTGKVTKVQNWTDALFSLTVHAPVLPFTAGQFTKLGLEIEGERVQRAYSYVNSPDNPDLEFYLVTVPDGKLSPRLAALKPGDEVQVVSEAAGFFVLDEVPDCETLWMLATGTAIGPYLSILQLGKDLERFKNMVLVHAARYAADLSYLPLMQELEKRYEGKLRIQTVVSRETAAGSLTGRLPALIESGELERAVGLPMNKETSHVMLCGNPQMVRDTQQLLKETFSTGLGFSFAIPHSKSEHIEQSTISVARLQAPVRWGDDEAQFIIMLTLNKHAAGDQHMRIFSRLARRIMHEEFRNALVNAASADAIASLLQHELEL